MTSSFKECALVSRAPTENFRHHSSLFGYLRPQKEVLCVNGLFIFLKLYLFFSVKHGWSAKGFKKTEEERSEYTVVCMLWIYRAILRFRTDILLSDVRWVFVCCTKFGFVKAVFDRILAIDRVVFDLNWVKCNYFLGSRQKKMHRNPPKKRTKLGNMWDGIVLQRLPRWWAKKWNISSVTIDFILIYSSFKVPTSERF